MKRIKSQTKRGNNASYFTSPVEIAYRLWTPYSYMLSALYSSLYLPIEKLFQL